MLIIKISIGLVAKLFEVLKNLTPVIINYIRRPRIIFKYENKHLTFTLDDSEHSLLCPCLVVTNQTKRKIRIKTDSIKFNGLLCKPILPDTKTSKYGANEYKYFATESCIPPSYGPYIELEPYESTVSPLKPLRVNVDFIRSKSTSTLLFGGRKKISVIINIGNIDYEYGIPRCSSYEKYINYITARIGKGYYTYAG